MPPPRRHARPSTRHTPGSWRPSATPPRSCAEEIAPPPSPPAASRRPYLLSPDSQTRMRSLTDVPPAEGHFREGSRSQGVRCVRSFLKVRLGKLQCLRSAISGGRKRQRRSYQGDLLLHTSGTYSVTESLFIPHTLPSRDVYARTLIPTPNL